MAAKPKNQSQLSKATKARIDAHHAASAQRALGAEIIAFESLNGPVKGATYELVQHVAAAPDAQKVQAAQAGIKQVSTTLQQNYEQAAVKSLGHARKLAMMQVESEAVEAQALLKQLMGVDIDLGQLMQIMGDDVADAATASSAATSAASKWQNSKLAQIGSSQLQGEAANQMVKALANNGAMQPVLELHASTLSFGAYGAQHTKAWNELAPGAKQPIGLKNPVEPVPWPLPPAEGDSPFDSGPEQGLPYGWGEGMMQIWSAILDRKTCATCWSLDGSMVPIGKEWPGFGKPPAHPRCRCIPVTLFIPEALSVKLPGIQIDYGQLKADIKDYMRGSSLKLGEGARHARAYIAEALQGQSPSVLTKKLLERKSYFPAPGKPGPKPPKGGPILPSTPKGAAKVTKELKETKAKLGAAITKAEQEAAKRKAAEAALAKTQAEMLKAHQAAKLAQAEGQAALKKLEAAIPPKPVAKPSGPTPQEKLEAAKAKAAAYKAEQAALAAKKAEEQALLAAKALEAKAIKEIEAIQLMGYGEGQVLSKDLQAIAKQDPKLFATIWSKATGKPASAIEAKLATPLGLGQAAKEAAKKLQPNASWPLTKTQKAKLAKEEAKAAEAAKAALAAKKPVLEQAFEAPNSIAFVAKLTPAELDELVGGLPEIAHLAGGLHGASNVATVATAIEDWQSALKDAASMTVKPVEASGKVWMDVYDGDKKVSYFFKEGEKFVVKPPTSVYMKPQSFDDELKAKAYSIQVSTEIAKSKAEAAAFAAEEAAEKAAQKAAAAKAAPKPAPAPVPAAPPSKVTGWSEDYKRPERAAMPMAHDKPISEVKAKLKANRDGHATLMDKDFVENFEVSFVEEIVNGQHELVARFKVNEHRAEEVLAKLKQTEGAGKGTYRYSKLKDLSSEKLDMSTADTYTPRSVAVTEGKVGTSRITMQRQQWNVDGDNLAATHNLVEIRTPVTAKKAADHAQAVNSVIEKLGINTDWPAEDALAAHKRARILAYVDRTGGNELAKLTDRSPAAIDKVWKKAVKRNPMLAEIEADAVLREVSPGHSALYSDRLARHFQEAGVQWLKHNARESVEILDQMFLQNGGLLSSRERFQRGLLFRGMSTETDFETGGADSVFLRVRSSPPPKWREGALGIEIDPSEMGRMDAYFYNADEFGKAGPGNRASRKTAMELADIVRAGRLSDSNEIMMQRQVAPSAIRRVTMGPATRSQMLAKFKEAGISKVNGIPVEDLLVAP